MGKQKNERIKVRWNPGWVAIPSTIIRDTSVSRNARLLWCLIASYAGNDESTWPSQENLCEGMGEGGGAVARQSIHRWTIELWRAGWITITRTAHGHEYELHEPTVAMVLSRREQKSPFDAATDVTPRLPRCNSPVTSDVTPELLPTISIDLKTKTHHQEGRAANAAGGGDGASHKRETPTALYLRGTVGLVADSVIAQLADLDLDAVRREWESTRAESGSLDKLRGRLVMKLRALKARPADAPATADAAPLILPNLRPEYYSLTTDEQQRLWREFDRRRPTGRTA